MGLKRKLIMEYNRRRKPLVMHIEAIHNDWVWRELKGWTEAHPDAKLYAITPEDYLICRAETGFKGSKKELGRIMADRYSQIANLNLHVHLAVKRDLIQPNRKLHKSLAWMKSVGIHPKEVSFGWWQANSSDYAQAEDCGLKIAKELDGFCIHDYDLIPDKESIREKKRRMKI